MATNDQRKTLNDALSATLSRTIDFLKFAETKNAALLTFASAWLVALSNLLASDHMHDRGPRIAVAASMLFFASAALTAIYSFLPRLKLGSFQRDPERQKSLLFFGDISEFEATAYAARFAERYSGDAEQGISSAYLHDLAVQVAANSVITLHKFRVFNIGAVLVMVALLVLLGTAACLGYNHLWTTP
ncbi:Pycsar system effector family protein [Bradyrhizobium sp. ma5]|uniref:Pycsar system effector family protein n=1 Tax=Bradyrhizobium sp. ma5 TaxID=3344828 RepID=UPI0035D4EC23